MPRIYVTGEDRIIPSENNLVDLILADGRVITRLEPRRLFPVSRESEYITLLGEGGAEAAIIKKLSELDADSREVIFESLMDFYLVPHILKILSKVEKYGTLRWTVETDRGIKSFDIRNRNHDIRVYKNGAVRVRDSDDNRYTIDNYHNLDPQSKARLLVDI